MCKLANNFTTELITHRNGVCRRLWVAILNQCHAESSTSQKGEECDSLLAIMSCIMLDN